MHTMIVVFILFLLMTSSNSQYFNTVNENKTRCIYMYFLGISERTNTGEAIPVKICLIPSKSFRVSIVGTEYDESLFNSFIVAGYVLNKICEADLGEVEVYMQNVGSAKGSSASLAFAIALYSILNNYGNTSLSATGVVSIDGFIDAVAGLNKKIGAAISAGIKKIYVPLINDVNATNTVIPIATILDICNRNVRNAEFYVNKTLLDIVNSYFENVTSYFINEAIRIANNLGDTSVYEYVKNKENNILKAINRGHWYAAASIAYSTFTTVLEEYLAREKGEALNRYVLLCENGLHNISKTLNEVRSVKAETVPFLIIAINRATLARYYLNTANESSFSDPATIASAYGRVVTALHWLALTKLVNSSSSGSLYSFNNIENALTRVLNTMSSIVEFDKNYTILSLDGIANMRSSQYSRLSNTSKQYIKNSLENLLKVYQNVLGENLILVPYLYYQYSMDVDDVSSIYLLSIATLEAGVTSMVLDVASNIFNLVTSSGVSSNTFPGNLLGVVLYESIFLCIILIVAIKKLFEVVK
ncbi:MAG: S16 family serine protease [Ignisphaera sp.]